MGESAEVIIVGAGPAGLALAALLGAQGREVLLLDKSPAPRDKVCGEGLMPLGIAGIPGVGGMAGMEPLTARAALGDAGLTLEALPGQDFLGLEYRSPRQQVLLDFSPGVRGRGVRRTVLIEALQAAALAHPSVRLTDEHVLGPIEVEGVIRGVRGRSAEYRAQIVVAADGVQSRLAVAAGMRVWQKGYRMGLRRHYRLADSGAWDRVRIGLFSPYDVYLTPVGGGVVLATTMSTRAGYDAIRTDYEAFLRGTPFGEIFEGALPDSHLMGWHHPLCTYRGSTHGGHGGRGGRHGRRFEHRGLLLLGDAGGSLDPCLGMGISLALCAAGHAATAVNGILEAPDSRETPAKAYEAALRRLFRHYSAFDYVFRSMVASKTRSELLLWAMRHWPETANAILAAVAEGSSWRNISLRSIIFPRKRGHATLG